MERSETAPRPWRRVAIGTLAVLGLLTGCGSSNGSAADATQPSVAPQSTTTAPTTVPATTLATVPPTTVPSRIVWMVALGDSMPGGGRCAPPCQAYPSLLGDLAAARLGAQVRVSNLASNDSLTSTILLDRVTSDESYRKAITRSDIVTIQVGFNDWQGPCEWEGHEACVADGAAQVQTNLAKILQEIAVLRAGAPTAVRVVTYYDDTIGAKNTASNWHYKPAEDAAFHAFYGPALTEFDRILCQVATANGAACIDLATVFNGPDHSADAGDLLGSDHLHPSKKGHELIATTIDNLGYGPIG